MIQPLRPMNPSFLPPAQLFAQPAQPILLPALPADRLQLTAVSSGSATPRVALGAAKAPLAIQLYRSYGNDQEVTIKGRVMEPETYAQLDQEASWWQNFKSNFRLLGQDEAEYASVDVSFNGKSVRVQTNEEGMFSATIRDFGPVRPGYQTAQATLATPPGTAASVATGMVTLHPKADTTFGIVSDIDDTIQKSAITHKWQALKILLFRNPVTQEKVPGMAELYQGLERRNDGQIDGDVTYISGSPVQITHRIERFLQGNGYPAGAMELKKMGLGPGEDNPVKQQDFKLSRIRRLFNTYPAKQFLLFGDNGEKDPEIYRQIAQEFPGRVLGIYINNVRGDSSQAARYTGMTLTHSTAEAAQDLYHKGLLGASDLQQVQQAVASLK